MRCEGSMWGVLWAVCARAYRRQEMVDTRRKKVDVDRDIRVGAGFIEIFVDIISGRRGPPCCIVRRGKCRKQQSDRGRRGQKSRVHQSLTAGNVDELPAVVPLPQRGHGHGPRHRAPLLHPPSRRTACTRCTSACCTRCTSSTCTRCTRGRRAVRGRVRWPACLRGGGFSAVFTLLHAVSGWRLRESGNVPAGTARWRWPPPCSPREDQDSPGTL